MRRIHADPLREVAAIALMAPASTPNATLENVLIYCWEQLGCRRTETEMADLMAKLRNVA